MSDPASASGPAEPVEAGRIRKIRGRLETLAREETKLVRERDELMRVLRDDHGWGPTAIAELAGVTKQRVFIILGPSVNPG